MLLPKAFDPWLRATLHRRLKREAKPGANRRHALIRHVRMLRKASSYVPVCRAFLMELRSPRRTDFHEILYWNIFSDDLPRMLRFRYDVTRITGALHEDRCTFMITSRWIQLRMRNVSDKSCREDQITHFAEDWKSNLMSLAILFHFLCA